MSLTLNTGSAVLSTNNLPSIKFQDAKYKLEVKFYKSTKAQQTEIGGTSVEKT